MFAGHLFDQSSVINVSVGSFPHLCPVLHDNDPICNSDNFAESMRNKKNGDTPFFQRRNLRAAGLSSSG
jgi:hypothetical protein